MFFNELLAHYLVDVVEAGVRRSVTYENFLVALANNVGQELQLNLLAASVGISTRTARHSLSIAQATGAIHLLPAFPEIIKGRAVIKKPKLYFVDTGFASWLCKIPSPEALVSSPKGGNFFENFVVMEIFKSWVHNGKQPLFYHYRDTKFNKVSLLIKVGTHYFPVQILPTEYPQADMVKSFEFIKGENFQKDEGALICLCSLPKLLSSNVVAHSIWDI